MLPTLYRFPWPVAAIAEVVGVAAALVLAHALAVHAHVLVVADDRRFSPQGG